MMQRSDADGLIIGGGGGLRARQRTRRRAAGTLIGGALGCPAGRKVEAAGGNAAADPGTRDRTTARRPVAFPEGRTFRLRRPVGLARRPEQVRSARRPDGSTGRIGVNFVRLAVEG